MFKFLIRHIKWIIVAVGLLFFVLTQSEWLTQSRIWQHIEGLLIDQRYRQRGVRPGDPDIKLLGVENSTISLDELWPEEITASEPLQLMQKPVWDRRIYAAVLEKLMQAHAKVVVFDFLFAAQTDGDDVFAQELNKYSANVVIGAKVEQEEANGEIYCRYTGPNDRLLLPGTSNITGIVTLKTDLDGVTRRGIYRTSKERETPKLSKYAGTKYPDDLIHMSALAVEKFAGHVSTPPYDHANFINFRGPEGTYDVLPMEKIFVEKLWKAPPYSSGTVFSNKIVIVGPIAEIYHDVHETPFGNMPGPEIQAQMMATLLQDGSLGELTRGWNTALTLLATILALGICLWIQNALLKVLLLIVTTAVFLVAGQLVFTHDNTVLTMLPALFCLVGTGAYGTTFQFALEQFERRRTKNVLERYVSKNVAKTILEDKRSFEKALSGRKQPVTILFSDIRGFTSMTEAVEPDQLVNQLNEYFLEMVGIVLKEDGTLQKFIGDAIMAAWGDTHSEGLAEDARRAVNAALQMRPALKKLNETWKDNPDRKPLATGIGVNQGEVIVGNIGHPQRMEFTVLGDGVNLAARLESATKQFHADILIGETVEKLTRDHFIFRTVDLLTVKGKTKPVEVFTLLSDKSQPPPPWLAPYQEAIKLYRGRQFTQAIAAFKTVLETLGGKDFLCEMYIERCSEYELVPPPENWNGAFILTEK